MLKSCLTILTTNWFIVGIKHDYILYQYIKKKAFYILVVMLYFGRGPTLFPSYDTSDLLQHWTYDSCWSDVHSIFFIQSVRWGQVIGFDNFCLVLRIDRLGALRLLNNFASDLWNVCIFPYICHLTYKCVHLTYKSFASDLKKIVHPTYTKVVHLNYKCSASDLQKVCT